jgi:hypothetical protein
MRRPRVRWVCAVAAWPQSRRCGGPPGPAPVDILSAYRLYAQHYVYEVEAETLPLFYWDDNNRLKPRTTVTIHWLPPR